MRLLVVWVINAVALFVLPYPVPSIYIRSFGSAMLAALVLGPVNTLIRPVLVILTLPVTLLTLGLFIFVINALLFLFVGRLLSGFVVEGFGSALLGSILYSVISGCSPACCWANAAATEATRPGPEPIRAPRKGARHHHARPLLQLEFFPPKTAEGLENCATRARSSRRSSPSTSP